MPVQGIDGLTAGLPDTARSFSDQPFQLTP